MLREINWNLEREKSLKEVEFTVITKRHEKVVTDLIAQLESKKQQKDKTTKTEDSNKKLPIVQDDNLIHELLE